MQLLCVALSTRQNRPAAPHTLRYVMSRKQNFKYSLCPFNSLSISLWVSLPQVWGTTWRKLWSTSSQCTLRYEQPTHVFHQALFTLCLCLFPPSPHPFITNFLCLRSSRFLRIWCLGFYLKLLSQSLMRCVVLCSVCPPSAKTEPCRYTLTFTHIHTLSPLIVRPWLISRPPPAETCWGFTCHFW